MKSEKDRVNSLLDQANSARGENRFEDAKHRIQTAVKLSQQLSNTEYLAQSLNDLARIERDLGNIDASLSLYEELFDLYFELKNKHGQVHTMKHLGDIFRDEDRLEEADAFFQVVIEYYESAGADSQSDINSANAYRGYALLKERQGQISEAMSYWKKAKAIYKKHQILQGVEECDRWIQKLK